jgi:hypothetical protein
VPENGKENEPVEPEGISCQLVLEEMDWIPWLWKVLVVQLPEEEY